MKQRKAMQPAIDQAAIDRGVARAKRERTRAVLAALRGLFRAAAPGSITIRDHKPA